MHHLKYYLFGIITLTAALFSIYWIKETNGACWDTIVYSRGSDQFMDFFNHIAYAKDFSSLYGTSVHACFPPLIYLMYGLFSKMLPEGAIVMFHFAETSSYARLFYVVYCVIMTVFLFYSIHKLLKKSLEISLWLTLTVLFSNTFIFEVLERGNSTLIVCIFLLRALELKEHDSHQCREAALIYIAAASAVKIYPAVFGLLYLLERRWKEAVRLVLYGILFFFVPFAAFGGWNAAAQFMENQLAVQSGNYSGGGIMIIGIRNIRMCVNLIADRYLGVTPSMAAVMAITILWTLLLLFCCCHADAYWKKVFSLVSIMATVPLWSGGYTKIYYLIPLILFFRTDSAKKVQESVYTVLFSCMFLFMMCSNPELETVLNTDMPSAITYLAVYSFSILLIAQSLFFNKFFRQHIKRFRIKGCQNTGNHKSDGKQL